MHEQQTHPLLTLHYELHDGLSGFDVEAVVLAGLAAVRSGHLTGDVDNAQNSIVTFGLHVAIRHGRFFISTGPKDDGFGFAGDQALQLYCVTLLSGQRGLSSWDGQVGRN